jgi:hypothetical protein
MSRRVLLAVAAILALFVSLTGLSRADTTITVPNYSFEADVVSSGNQTAAHTDWTVVNGNSSYVYTRNPTSAEFAALPDGSQCLVNTATSYSSPDVALLGSNSLSIPVGNGGLQAGVTYTMTVSIGMAANGGNFGGFSFGFVDPTAQMLIVNNEFSRDDNPSAGHFVDLSASLNASDVIGTQGIAPNGSVTTIQQDDAITPLIILGAGAYLDNVRISISNTLATEGFTATAIPAGYTIPAPEPSTLALLATGLLGLLAYAWRRRTKR